MHISRLWNRWEFGYRLWDLENRKLIRSNDVVFNEDLILFERNQQKIVGKNVSFDTDRNVVEGLTHRAKSKIRQIVEIDQANNNPADSELATCPLVEIDSITRLMKADKDKVKPTKAKVTLSITLEKEEDYSTSPTSYCRGESSNRILEDDSSNTNRLTDKNWHLGDPDESEGR